MARYDLGFSFYDDTISRYDDPSQTPISPGSISLDTVFETRVKAGQDPQTIGDYLRVTYAVLTGRDTGAGLNSRVAQFFAPDGTTRRLYADLDGQGNRTNTDPEPGDN